VEELEQAEAWLLGEKEATENSRRWLREEDDAAQGLLHELDAEHANGRRVCGRTDCLLPKLGWKISCGNYNI
jgi:hypothetical protein